MTESQTITMKKLIAAFSDELKRWMEERKTGLFGITVRLNQGGVTDNRFNHVEERKIDI